MKRPGSRIEKELIKYRVVFIIILAIWIFGLDAIILDSLKTNQEFMNYDTELQSFITGSFGRVIPAPSREQAIPHMLIFNAIIAVCFTMSYFSWENKKKKLLKKR